MYALVESWKQQNPTFLYFLTEESEDDGGDDDDDDDEWDDWGGSCFLWFWDQFSKDLFLNTCELKHFYQYDGQKKLNRHGK